MPTTEDVVIGAAQTDPFDPDQYLPICRGRCRPVDELQVVRFLTNNNLHAYPFAERRNLLRHNAQRSALVNSLTIARIRAFPAFAMIWAHDD